MAGAASVYQMPPNDEMGRLGTACYRAQAAESPPPRRKYVPATSNISSVVFE
jgi:hypothetical protein